MTALKALITSITGQDGSYLVASSHVIPALIRKCVDAREAGADHFDVWGTGAASREFLYVEDAAEGIVLATERYDEADPVNLGVGREITVLQLVDLIVRITGFTGEIRRDAAKPDGQLRRALDTGRARERFGFKATTSFETGLRATVDCYDATSAATVR